MFIHENSNIWIVDLIITDNEAVTVENALQQKGFEVEVSKQTHWEISCSKNSTATLKQIDDSGEDFGQPRARPLILST